MLNNHKAEAHGEGEPGKAAAPSLLTTDGVDHVKKYTKTALSMRLLALVFTRARQHGNGETIIMIHKYFLTIFKLAHKTKYTLYTYLTLCQVKLLLPDFLANDIVNNRFTNSQGKANSNVEIDRHCEHSNRTFKADCRGLNGKYTDSAIERSSKSFERVQGIMACYDEFASVKNPSRWHSKTDTERKKAIQ